MAQRILPLILGVAIGAGGFAIISSGIRDESGPQRTVRQTGDPGLALANETLRSENALLRQQVAEGFQAPGGARPGEVEPKEDVAETPTKQADADAAGPLTDKQIEDGFKKYGASLQLIITGKGAESIAELRKLIKAAGPRAIKMLRKTWRDESGSFVERLVAAHIMAQSGDADALEEIKATVRDPDKGMIEHRLASHALAFAEVDGLEPLLTDIARNGSEPGVRANASFGLARRGSEEGIELYMAATDDAFEAHQPEALQFLGGIALLGEKAKPYVYERLLSYESETAVVTLIEIVKSWNDRGAVLTLTKLAQDAGRPAVQKSAAGALKALENR